MKRNKMYGMMLRPASTTDADNEAVMHSSDYSVSSNFSKEYCNHIAAMQIVAECAKIYVLNNWEKVKDWTDIEVVMEDANTLSSHLNKANGGNPLEDYVEYFKYTGKRLKRKINQNKNGHNFMDDFMNEMDEKDKARHNPATSVSGVVLDTSDGDFSLTINGRQHMWISDSTVIIIADYIENQLIKEKE